MMAERHGIVDASAGIRYGGKTDPAIVEEIFAARLGRAPTAAEREAFLDAYIPRLVAMLAEQGVEVLPGVVEALEFLQGKARLGVATGNIRAGAQAKLEAAHLAHWFDLGGYGCDSHLRPELVAAAIRRAGPCDEVIVVGDTIHDISAARACGATVCAVATGSDSAQALAHRREQETARVNARHHWRSGVRSIRDFPDHAEAGQAEPAQCRASARLLPASCPDWLL